MAESAMAESANKKAQKVSLAKVVLIVILLIIVAILAIKTGMDASSSGQPEATDANAPHHPLRPNANPRDRWDKRQVCYTPECIQKSSSLFKSMNMEADPCQDFNEYACGNFIKNVRIPDDRGRWNNFDVISERIYERGRSILEEPIQPGDWEAFKMSKRYYKACMDEEKREELGIKPMQDYLEQFGGWPVLEQGWTRLKSGMTRSTSSTELDLEVTTLSPSS